MSAIRNPAVAGTFYPANPEKLKKTLEQYLAAAAPPKNISPSSVRAIIAPHAGYQYSGSTAAEAYSIFIQHPEEIKKIILLGPSHYTAFHGLAIPDADFFSTPLGDVPVDRDMARNISHLPQVNILGEAHEREHSLEVQLPFLQKIFGSFTVLPILTGKVSSEEIAEVLELLAKNEKTLIVVSSDLSHFYSYDTAMKMDRETTSAIEALNKDGITNESACGRTAVKGLLLYAKNRGFHVKTVRLCNSGDTSGDKHSVVGYGAYIFTVEE